MLAVPSPHQEVLAGVKAKKYAGQIPKDVPAYDELS
jgi:hypothetical protein